MTSCVGAAVGVKLTPEQARLCMVDDLQEILTPQAIAYARARGNTRKPLMLNFKSGRNL